MEDVPGQTFIANNGTARENISAFLDFYFKTTVPTYSTEHMRFFVSFKRTL